MLVSKAAELRPHIEGYDFQPRPCLQPRVLLYHSEREILQQDSIRTSRQTSKIQMKFLVGAAHHPINDTLLPPLWSSLASSVLNVGTCVLLNLV